MKPDKSVLEELGKITSGINKILIIILAVGIINFIIRISFYTLRRNDIIFFGVALLIIVALMDYWLPKKRSKIK